MKTHTKIGAAILAGSRSPLVQMAELIALTHHERWDGRGYPAGLRGERSRWWDGSAQSAMFSTP